MAGTSEQLGWVFDLVDKYSANADRMTRSTDGFMAAMKRAESGLSDMEKASDRASSSLGTLNGLFGSWGTWQGAIRSTVGLVGDLASGFARVSLEVGKFVIQTLAQKETTLTSFELMLGSADKAKALYKDAVAYARMTPFETTDVVGGFQGLLSAGFNVDQTKVLFQALGDVASTQGDRAKESLRGMTLALSQIKALGHLSGQDLHQITTWGATAGIGVGGIYEHLAKLLKVDKKAIPGMQEAGAISADAFVMALTQTINDKFHGIGNLMEKQSHTISGLLSNLFSAPTDFIDAMDTDESHGLKKFKGFLENLSDMLNPLSDSGKEFGKLFDRVFNDAFGNLFDGLSGPEGMHKLEDFFARLITTTGKLYDVTSKFISLLDRLAPSLTTIEKVLDRLNKFAAPDFSGVKGVKTFANDADMRSQYAPDPTGKHWYPTKEWEAKFGNTDFGRAYLARPENAGSVEVAEEKNKALGEAITAGITYKDIGNAVTAPARRSGGGSQVVVHLAVNVDASSVTDPAGVVAAIKELLPAELEHLFQRLATETGSG